MDYYTTQHLTDLFGVTHQTIKQWAKEFAAYLSPTATPESGRKRMFTPGDVQVLALVNEYRKRGYRWDDAHTALRTGQRGEVPDVSRAIASQEGAPAAVVLLQEQVSTLKEQLRSTQSERDGATAQAQLLKEQLAEAQRQLREAYEEIGRLKRQD